MNQYKITAVLPVTYNVEAENIDNAEDVALEEFKNRDLSGVEPVIHDIEMIIEDWGFGTDKVFKTEIMSGISNRIYNIKIYSSTEDYDEYSILLGTVVFMQDLETDQVEIFVSEHSVDEEDRNVYYTSWNLESLRAEDLIKAEFVERLSIDLELVVPEDMKHLFRDWTYEQII